MKSIVLLAIMLLVCIALNEALQCYSHEPCSSNCPQLTNSIKSCSVDDNRCYKATFPGGVSRGCAKERCNVQWNANAVTAHVCCEKDLCNAATTSKVTFSAVFLVVGTILLARM